MSIAIYTLLMVGCADDGSACQRIAFDAPAYSASAQCEAQVKTALTSDTALRADYPVIDVRCIKVSKQPAAKPRGIPSLAVR
jgi:hypothetical protein